MSLTFAPFDPEGPGGPVAPTAPYKTGLHITFVIFIDYNGTDPHSNTHTSLKIIAQQNSWTDFTCNPAPPGMPGKPGEPAEPLSPGRPIRPGTPSCPAMPCHIETTILNQCNQYSDT